MFHFNFTFKYLYFEIQEEFGQSRIAFVTFTDPKALEIALLLSVCNFHRHFL